jgi:inosine-uridine nucleoside N-ribohydrolase
MMGGAVFVPGNINVVGPDYTNKVAEWNFFLDLGSRKPSSPMRSTG